MTDPARRRSLGAAIGLTAAGLALSGRAGRSMAASGPEQAVAAARLGPAPAPGPGSSAVVDPATTTNPRPTRTSTFAIIGDTPYSTLEERSLRDVLASQPASVVFVLHLGDLKSGWERCSDDLLRHRHGLLSASARPLVFVPGDNEWVDCTRLPAGGFDPLDRLEMLRRLFHQADPAPASAFGGFSRQPASEGSTAFPEHMRWHHEGVGFLTLNVPGSHDARSSEPRLAQANSARRSAVLRWLDETRAWASASRLRALVIASHANPNYERDRRGEPPVGADDPDDAYAWWRQGLRTLAEKLPVPMLLLHGDTHTYRIDRPLRDRNGHAIGHIVRLESYGTPRASRWLTVTIPAGPIVGFSITSHELEATRRP